MWMTNVEAGVSDCAKGRIRQDVDGGEREGEREEEREREGGREGARINSHVSDKGMVLDVKEGRE